MQAPPVLVPAAPFSPTGVTPGVGTAPSPSSDPFAAIFARLLQSSEAFSQAGFANTLLNTGVAIDPLAVGDPAVAPGEAPFPAAAISERQNVGTFSPRGLDLLGADFAPILDAAPEAPIVAEAPAPTPNDPALALTNILFTSPAPTITPPSPVFTPESIPPTTRFRREVTTTTTDGLLEKGTALSRDEFAAEEKPRKLQPFQGSFARPRFVDPRVEGQLDKDAQTIAAPRPVSLESLLGGERQGRIVVDKSVLRALDKLVGRQPVRTEILERGVSVLTPEELRPESSTTEDRNATALARNDRSEFVDRVMQALERARAEAPKRIEVELNPPSLGKLKLQVIEQDGQLTAKIEVQSTATRSLLLDNLPTLDRQLGEHGVQIQRFQVDQTNTGSNAPNDPNGGGPSQGNQQPEDRRQGRDPHRVEFDEDDSNRGPPVTVMELFSLADGMDRMV